MITAAQMRAARALLGLDQRRLAERAGLSLPTIQRMEASEGVVRGNVDSLMKLVDALAANGIELIGEGATSSRGWPRRTAQMNAPGKINSRAKQRR
jgi:transcriptional regulator with XRE-family HTH domain